MIPHRIHQIWFQSEKNIPKKYHGYQKSWKDNHPQWEYKVWDEKSMSDLIRQEDPVFHENTWTQYKLMVHKYDSARFFILRKYGGFYVDMDMQCLKPLDDLCLHYNFVAGKYFGYIVNTGIIGSIPHHPIWDIIVRELPFYAHRKWYQLSDMHYAVHITFLLGWCIYKSGLFKDPTTFIAPPYMFEPEGLLVNVNSSRLKDAYAWHDHGFSWMQESWTHVVCYYILFVVSFVAMIVIVSKFASRVICSKI